MEGTLLHPPRLTKCRRSVCLENDVSLSGSVTGGTGRPGHSVAQGQAWSGSGREGSRVMGALGGTDQVGKSV